MTSNLKGLVLAGGSGSRLRPLTATGAKQLVPVANKPVLFYALEQLVEAGITEIGIVTGETGAQVRDAVGDGSALGARVTYIPQTAPLGLAHAVMTAEAFLGDAPFCMFLGDNFLRRGIAAQADQFRSSGASGQILLQSVRDPSAFGVAVLDEHGRVLKLVEKPKTPVSDLAIVGVYFFRPGIHRIVAGLKPSARGELEITDAIQGLIEAGEVVEASIITDRWIDTGKKDDVLEANRVVLTDLAGEVLGSVDAETRITGEVRIEAGATVVRSTLRGPAVIGAGARIEDTYIGPFTSIGPNCLLQSSQIEHSVVLEGSTIRHVSQLIADSLIGKAVVIEQSRHLPRAIRLMLGDHSQVGVP